MAIAKLSQSANAKHSKSEAGKTEKRGGGGRGGDGTSWLYTGGVGLGFGNLVGRIWGIETLSGGDCTPSACHKIFGGVL